MSKTAGADHKVWKSEGTGVEGRRVQSKGNLDRLATIFAFLAVRLFQLTHGLAVGKTVKEMEERQGYELALSLEQDF